MIEIFCLPEFEEEYRKLIKNNSYKSLTKELLKFLNTESIDELASGTLLNRDQAVPYIKKRLSGRGGFRLYYLLIIKNDSVYLLFVHPKTGSKGASNISDEAKKDLYVKAVDLIKEEKMIRVLIDEEGKTLQFTPPE